MNDKSIEIMKKIIEEKKQKIITVKIIKGQKKL
ncbi:hypothetical protein B0I68_001018 [Clostridium beijerinckii]|nr:hypothetical protein [Clostridium beijerinckii]NRV83044.1 hypothetical protein [Clostridium beijerinckii]NRW82625.1 hypothetical protein [Clostridium beijerinckii]NRY47485.1 hypothetical protein [Clostridium beijerinckii]NRY75487.1 hypothetical protein [Clostridium beijerinckii]